MLITDLKGRAWWCPDCKDATSLDVQHLIVKLTDEYWIEYNGPWNINPGAMND